MKWPRQPPFSTTQHHFIGTRPSPWSWWSARPTTSPRRRWASDRSTRPRRPSRCRDIGRARFFGRETLACDTTRGTLRQPHDWLQKSDQGIGAVSNRSLRVFDHMVACACQRGSHSRRTRGMVCRRRVPIGCRRQSIAHWPETRRNRPKRDFSPQRTPIILLWRSRRAVGRVRTAPGAPPTAAASPDGREARHRKSPWE